MSCVPELRFKEFSGDWDERKLGEVIQFESSKYNPQRSKENFKCIELEHLSQESGKLLGYCNSQDQSSIKNIFKENNILFGKLRPYLRKFWLANFEGVCSTEIWVFTGKNSLNKFIFQLIQTNKFNYISNVSSGSKMPRSDWNFMKDINFNIPSLNEQEKIANFLSKIDEKIAILEDKLELWETYKKGIMQQLFSQELRFKDDEGNSYPVWEEMKLGNIADVTKLAGFEFTKYVDYKDHGNIIALRGLNIKNNKLDLSDVKYIDGCDLTKLKRSKLFIGDLLFTYVGTIGEVAIILENDKYYLAPNVCRIRCSDNIDYNFLKFIFNTDYMQKSEIPKFITKSSQPSLSMENIRKFSIKIPTSKEQEKIANFLTNIDEKIQEIANDLENNNSFKKGLLQKMFC